MTWFKVDDSFHSHPKSAAVSLAAIGLWTVAGSWCGTHLTDGFVPAHMIPILARGETKLADELVVAGLWTKSRKGFQFHEWSERNPEANDVKALRAKRAAAGHKGGVASGKTRSKNEALASPLLKQNRTPDPTRPDLKSQSQNQGQKLGVATRTPPKRGTRIPADFDVTDEMKTWATTNTPNVAGWRETQKFINYWQAKSGAGATKLDWPATWRNWMLKAAEQAPNGRASPGLVAHNGLMLKPETIAGLEQIERMKALDEAQATRRPQLGGTG